MIVNFYKSKWLLKTANIDAIPRKDEFIMLSGQVFVVMAVALNLDSQEYDVYVKRSFSWKVK